MRKKDRWDRVFFSQPVVGISGIYLAEALDTKEIVKLDRATLSEVWRVKTDGWSPEVECRDGLLASSRSGHVGMYNPDSGKQVWAVRSPFTPPVMWKSHVLVVNEGFDLAEPRTGRIEEHIPLPWPVEVGILCGDCLLTIAGADPTRCYDLTRQQVVWQRDFFEEIRERYNVDEKLPVISFRPSSSPGGFITRRGHRATFGCSLADGRILWASPHVPGYSGSDILNGRIYGPIFDRFVALDETTGEVVFDVAHPELHGAMYPKPGAVYNGKVAYAMESGHLAVLDLTDGHLVWSYKHKTALGRAAEADGRLLVTEGDGHLLVFEE